MGRIISMDIRDYGSNDLPTLETIRETASVAQTPDEVSGISECSYGCGDMSEKRQLKPLLVSIIIMIVGMYFNCCMQGGPSEMSRTHK